MKAAYQSPELALFAHLVERPDEDIDLGQAAFSLGFLKNPSLDISANMRSLDQLAQRAKAFCQYDERPAIRLSQFLFLQEKFRGNTEEYENPSNSLLDQVLRTKLGIPISLSVLMMEIGKRAGIPIEGISFPGHFLVRAPLGGNSFFVFDPYHSGMPLSQSDLKSLYTKMTGKDEPPPNQVLQKANHTTILTRMLTNLRSIFEKTHDLEGSSFVLERLRLLQPSDEEIAKALVDVRNKQMSFRTLN